MLHAACCMLCVALKHDTHGRDPVRWHQERELIRADIILHAGTIEMQLKPSVFQLSFVWCPSRASLILVGKQTLSVHKLAWGKKGRARGRGGGGAGARGRFRTAMSTSFSTTISEAAIIAAFCAVVV
jgi:hypothetical protein